MSLKDIFSSDPIKRPALGSGSEAVINEFLDDDENEEQSHGIVPTDSLINSGMGNEELLPEQSSEKFLNRMIKIEGLPIRDLTDQRQGIFDDGKLLEQVILSSHDQKTMKKDIRRYLDNIAVRSGDGNLCCANERDKVLLMRLLMTRSLTDTEISANERSLWTVRESRTKQSLTTNNGQQKGAPGFLSRLFGR